MRSIWTSLQQNSYKYTKPLNKDYRTPNKQTRKKKMASVTSHHIVLFPFMAKGHTIPVLNLAHILLTRNISVTIFTTPSNSPFIRQSLTNTQASIIELPFPQNIPQLPPQIESTDKLPSMSLFVPFAKSTKLMQPHFDQALQDLPSVTCLITDGFLGWTQQSASKLGVPRLVFDGISNYVMTIYNVLTRDRPHVDLDSDDEPFNLPSFPWIKLTRNDFEPPFNNPEPKGPFFDFIVEQLMTNIQSKGYIVNSFYELEPGFLDYWNRECGLKAWCVGPLCLAEPPKIQPKEKPIWVNWLDEKSANGQTVLYVAFGSQAEITSEQLVEIAIGLEKSEVNFLWVVRSNGLEVLEGFEEKVKDRGLIVREWVDQVEILSHECVNGFMSHCGWNSVMESICASVPILAFPIMMDQPLNARMVTEELGIGVRVLAKNGSVRGFISWEDVERKVRELMEGEKAKEVRKKVKEVGQLARKAMEEGGSSWRTLDKILEEMCYIDKEMSVTTEKEPVRASP